MTDPFEGAIDIKDIKDEDVGEELILVDYQNFHIYPFTRKVQMVIRAPKGRLIVLEPTDKATSSIDKRGEIVRAFMEMHKDD